MSYEHGTRVKYVEDGCRCDACKAANTDYLVRRRAERVAYAEVNGLPPTVKHGAAAYANWHCRCAVCIAAHRTRMRIYMRTYNPGGQTA